MEIAKTHQARVNSLFRSLQKKKSAVAQLELDILYAQNSPWEYIERLREVQRYLQLAIEVIEPIVSREEETEDKPSAKSN